MHITVFSFFVIAAVACTIAASSALAQATPAPAPTTTLAPITVSNYDAVASTITTNQEPRICIKQAAFEVLDFRYRPCIKTYYDDAWSWIDSYSSKYFYVCNASEIILYQCGNEWPKGDYAGDSCKPESNCVVREVFRPDGSWRPGHEIIDKNVKWDGKYYTTDFYLRQETWGHDINQHGRYCATPGGFFHSPRITTSRPASQKVCKQMSSDSGRSFKLDCGTAAAPRRNPQQLFYDTGDCSGADTNESWGQNNTCYRPAGSENADKYASAGPRWVCFPAEHHLAFILDTSTAAGLAGTGFVAVLMMLIISLVL